MNEDNKNNKITAIQENKEDLSCQLDQIIQKLESIEATINNLNSPKSINEVRKTRIIWDGIKCISIRVLPWLIVCVTIVIIQSCPK